MGTCMSTFVPKCSIISKRTLLILQPDWGTNGGKFGKAAVAYLEWQFRGDAKSKAICLDPKAPGSLVSDKWNVTFKNWDSK
jgi:hypothetical protein